MLLFLILGMVLPYEHCIDIKDKELCNSNICVGFAWCEMCNSCLYKKLAVTGKDEL